MSALTRREFLRRAGAVGAAGTFYLSGTTLRRAAGIVAAAPRTDQSLTIALAGDIVSLDPHVSATTFFRMVNTAIWDELVDIDPRTLGVVPNLAESFRQPTPQIIEMKLRDGVTFHSGHPFTAADVKYSLERVLNPRTGSPYRLSISSIERVTVVDRLNVRLNLAQPDPGLLTALHKVRILSEATDGTLDKQPNGTGPFLFAEWNHNQNILLRRFDKYRVPDRPLVGALNYRVIPEASARIAALETGEIHVLILVPLKDAGLLARTRGVAIQPPRTLDIGDVLYLNHRRKALSDARVRQAVAYAFNKELYMKTFLYGRGVMNMTPHAPANWAHNVAQRYRYPTIPERAARLLEEAGYPGGRGLELDMIFPIGFPEWKAAGEMFQAQMASLGGKVNVLELEPPVWIARMTRTREFDLCFNNLGGAVLDPSVPYTNAFLFTQGDGGVPGWSDPEIATLIQDGRRGAQSARKAKYFQLQQRWNDNMYSMILGQKQFVHAIRDKVTGWVTHPTYEQAWQNLGLA
jgi:peptide/nickel transport system substrate-binding protein